MLESVQVDGLTVPTKYTIYETDHSAGSSTFPNSIGGPDMITFTASRKLVGVSLLAVMTSFGFLWSDEPVAADSAKAEIEELLGDYERVLNGSDVDGVLKLYAANGVFMGCQQSTGLNWLIVFSLSF